MRNYQITEWCHHFIREHVKEGDYCIDATAGNGNDTQVLCEQVGESGKVLAFEFSLLHCKTREIVWNKRDCWDELN